MRMKWFGIGIGALASNLLLAAALTGCTSTSDTTAKSTEETASDATTVAGTTASEAQAALDESGLLTGGMFGGGMHGGPGRFGPMGGGGPFANLTDDQKAQLEAIWQQVQNGEITREQGHEQIQTLLGVILPAGGPHQRIADALGLTEEQKTAAEGIHTAARTDIEALAENGRTQFRALLTEEQIATLDSLEAERQASAGFYGPHSGGMGPHGFGGMGPGGFGHGPEGADGHVDRLAEALALTEEQQTAWATIRAETRAAIEARHETAREAFRALLTEEQLATLDQLEAQHGRP